MPEINKEDEVWIDEYMKEAKKDTSFTTQNKDSAKKINKKVAKRMPELDVAEKVNKLIEWIKNKDIKKLDGDTLTRFIYKLSVHRVNLAQELADAIGDADLAYLGRKVQFASEWNKLKGDINQKLTQKDMNSQTLLKIKDVQLKELELKRRADTLKFLYDSSATLIMTIQSRLKQLETESVESNYQKQNNYKNK